MNNEDLLQTTLSATIDRLAKQTKMYETEIANLNAQIIVLTEQASQSVENSSFDIVDKES